MELKMSSLNSSSWPNMAQQHPNKMISLYGTVTVADENRK